MADVERGGRDTNRALMRVAGLPTKQVCVGHVAWGTKVSHIFFLEKSVFLCVLFFSSTSATLQVRILGSRSFDDIEDVLLSLSVV